MNLTRRTFLSAVAAFVFGVQAQILRAHSPIRPPKPKRVPLLMAQAWSNTYIWVGGENIEEGCAVYRGADGLIYRA